MPNHSPSLPQTWDLASYFPSFEGPEYRAFKSALTTDLKSVLADAVALPALTADAAHVEDWVSVFSAWEGLVARMTHLSSYLGCLSAAD